MAAPPTPNNPPRALLRPNSRPRREGEMTLASMAFQAGPPRPPAPVAVAMPTAKMAYDAQWGASAHKKMPRAMNSRAAVP